MNNKAFLSLWLLLLWGACNQPAPDMPTSAVGQKILQLPYAKKFPSPHVELYTVAHFLTDAACDQLTNLIKSHLVPSQITGQDTDPDKYKHQKIRTSSTAYLSSLRDPAEQAFVDTIRQKISQALGIPLTHAEGIQGQHYYPGQAFKEHLDAFTPDTKEWVQSTDPTQGNRTWTVMIYLNNVEKGGGTYFSKLNHRFAPQKGPLSGTIYTQMEGETWRSITAVSLLKKEKKQSSPSGSGSTVKLALKSQATAHYSPHKTSS